MPTRLLVAVLPLAVTLLLGWLSAQGYLSQSEETPGIVFFIPTVVWSFFFLVGSFFPQPRKAALGKAVLLSVLYATGLSVIAWVALIAYVWLQLA